MPRYLGPLLALPQLLSIVVCVFELPLSFHNQDVADLLGFFDFIFELVPNLVVAVLLKLSNFDKLRLADSQKHKLLLHLYFNYRKIDLDIEVLSRVWHISLFLILLKPASFLRVLFLISKAYLA